MATPVCQITAFFIIYFTVGQGEILKVGLIIQDIFLSFACGTFIGIAFEEVIEVELVLKESKKTKFYKILTFVAGFIFISGVSIFEFLTVDSDISNK